MAANISVKICGLKDRAHIDMAAQAGASYVGFVFFEKSPRNIAIARAAELARNVPATLRKVALVVNADDNTLDAITSQVPLDMLQLHGCETPERVAEIKARYNLLVMKAIGIADTDDLPKIDLYSPVVDQLLIDAKPPKSADLPGGNGLAFDWRLLAGRTWDVPWMLAGGLTPETVSEAIRMTGATQVDVSSGVEASAGVKDARLVKRFVLAARA